MSTRLGASFPAHISRAGFRDVVLFKILDDEQSPIYGDCVSEIHLAAEDIAGHISASSTSWFSQYANWC